MLKGQKDTKKGHASKTKNHTTSEMKTTRNSEAFSFHHRFLKAVKI